MNKTHGTEKNKGARMNCISRLTVKLFIANLIVPTGKNSIRAQRYIGIAMIPMTINNLE
jgi:hypothetical protein